MNIEQLRKLYSTMDKEELVNIAVNNRIRANNLKVEVSILSGIMYELENFLLNQKNKIDTKIVLNKIQELKGCDFNE